MVKIIVIEDQTRIKPFLGGWRDELNNIEYHNATTQTPVLKKAFSKQLSKEVQTYNSIGKITRSCMTIEKFDRVVQTSIIPEITDVLLSPKRKWDTRVTEAAIKIQRFYRYYFIFYLTTLLISSS